MWSDPFNLFQQFKPIAWYFWCIKSNEIVKSWNNRLIAFRSEQFALWLRNKPMKCFNSDRSNQWHPIIELSPLNPDKKPFIYRNEKAQFTNTFLFWIFATFRHIRCCISFEKIRQCNMHIEPDTFESYCQMNLNVWRSIADWHIFILYGPF